MNPSDRPPPPLDEATRRYYEEVLKAAEHGWARDFYDESPFGTQRQWLLEREEALRALGRPVTPPVPPTREESAALAWGGEGDPFRKPVRREAREDLRSLPDDAAQALDPEPGPAPADLPAGPAPESWVAAGIPALLWRPEFLGMSPSAVLRAVKDLAPVTAYGEAAADWVLEHGTSPQTAFWRAAARAEAAGLSEDELLRLAREAGERAFALPLPEPASAAALPPDLPGVPPAPADDPSALVNRRDRGDRPLPDADAARLAGLEASLGLARPGLPAAPAPVASFTLPLPAPSSVEPAPPPGAGAPLTEEQRGQLAKLFPKQAAQIEALHAAQQGAEAAAPAPSPAEPAAPLPAPPFAIPLPEASPAGPAPAPWDDFTGLVDAAEEAEAEEEESEAPPAPGAARRPARRPRPKGYGRQDLSLPTPRPSAWQGQIIGLLEGLAGLGDPEEVWAKEATPEELAAAGEADEGPFAAPDLPGAETRFGPPGGLPVAAGTEPGGGAGGPLVALIERIASAVERLVELAEQEDEGGSEPGGWGPARAAGVGAVRGTGEDYTAASPSVGWDLLRPGAEEDASGHPARKRPGGARHAVTELLKTVLE